MPLSIGDTIDLYTVEELVDSSATVELYKVRHQKKASTHLLKILTEDQRKNPMIRTAFIRELKKLSNIGSPYLIRVQSVLTDNPVGIITDWVDGETLREYIDRLGRIERKKAFEWLSHILKGLHEMHTARIAHLEICPENILLTMQSDGTRKAMLREYGVRARLTGLDIPIPMPNNVLRGTSPEMIEKPDSAGPRSDIYSMGVLLYEMLTAESPYPDLDNLEENILSGRTVKIQERDPTLSENISQLISQAMDLNSIVRYPTAKSMLNACMRVDGDPLGQGGGREFDELVEGLDKKSEDLLFSDDGKKRDSESNLDSEERSKRAMARRKELRAQYKKQKTKRQFGISHFILLGVMLFFTYWSFGRGRDVFLFPEKMPEWGQIKFKMDDEFHVRTEFKKLSLGSHLIEISGGLYEDDECQRCCWTKEIPFSLSIGVGEFIMKYDALDENRNQRVCPTESLRFPFSFAPKGSFEMGTSTDQPDRNEREVLHRVTITHPFLISQTEVTQELYDAVIGFNPSDNQEDPKLPVEKVNWYEALEFCNALSIKEGLEACYEIDGENVSWDKGFECNGYRLPTEAEWDYAAQATSRKVYAGSNEIERVGWISVNAKGKTKKVGQLQANTWLLYDMSGNVMEWVWDIYQPYTSQEVIDPIGGSSGVYRVLRGGDVMHSAIKSRIADRERRTPRYRAHYIGFRIVRTKIENSVIE